MEVEGKEDLWSTNRGWEMYIVMMGVSKENKGR